MYKQNEQMMNSENLGKTKRPPLTVNTLDDLHVVNGFLSWTEGRSLCYSNHSFALDEE